MATITNSNEITLRQLFTAVVEGNITPAMQEKAKAEIAKLDATNAKRAEKAAEKAKENLPLKNTIFEFLAANGTKTTKKNFKKIQKKVLTNHRRCDIIRM